MPEIQSRTFEAGGMQLHALEVGEGHPVLFLHGWPTNAQLWRHVLPQVGKHRRAIALDLPGYGQSDKPYDASYDFAFYDRMLDAALEALDVQQLGLCVHDAGGAIGLHWAVQRADRITDLCLLNTVASHKVSFAVRAFVWSTKIPLLRGLMTGPWAAERAMFAGVRNKSRLTPEVLQIYRQPFEDANARAVYRKGVGALNWQGLEAIAQGLEQFKDTPVRLIYGTRDVILPAVARTMAGVQATLPHAELTALKLGHFLQEDDPDAVAELLREFFARRLQMSER